MNVRMDNLVQLHVIKCPEKLHNLTLLRPLINNSRRFSIEAEVEENPCLEQAEVSSLGL